IHQVLVENEVYVLLENAGAQGRLRQDDLREPARGQIVLQSRRHAALGRARVGLVLEIPEGQELRKRQGEDFERNASAAEAGGQFAREQVRGRSSQEDTCILIVVDPPHKGLPAGNSLHLV